jgi:hypothetical protein
MASTRTGSRSVNSTVAAVFGAVYTLVGIAGFFVSETFAATDDNTLLGFEVNHLHNIVHLLIGLALLGASRRTETARRLNLLIGGTTSCSASSAGSSRTPRRTSSRSTSRPPAPPRLRALLVAVALGADTRPRTRV